LRSSSSPEPPDAVVAVLDSVLLGGEAVDEADDWVAGR